MQIFFKNLEGRKTITLNVESREMTINSVKRKLEVEEGMSGDVVHTLIYQGRLLSNLSTLAYHRISEGSTLDFVTRKKKPHIYVDTLNGKIITLRIVDLNTIDDVKTKIYEQEGITPDTQCLFFADKELLDGNQTLSENSIEMESTLYLRGTIMNREGHQEAPSELTQLNVLSQGQHNLHKRPAPQVAPEPTKRVRLATQTTTSKATPSSRSIFDISDIGVCGELATCADRQAMSNNTYEAKLNEFALHQAKAAAARIDLMPEFRVRPPSSVTTELENVKRELATVRSKEKELEVTISSITQKCASYVSQIVVLKAENKEIEEELTVARSKEKDLEACISGLTHKNKAFSVQCASYKSQIVALEAEKKEREEKLTVSRNKEKKLKVSVSRLTHRNRELSPRHASYKSQIAALEAEVKKIKEELVVIHNKEKEQEATFFKLMHKNEVLSAQCASYFSQVFALEAENKKTIQVLIVARSKEKEQEATISDLTHKSKVFSEQLVVLEAENKKTKQELTEQEATISRLTHKNKVFSSECASYESQVVALEAENKKTKGELMNADKKYYSGARAAGYAEGLKEGKAKWLKSVEFLHHLTDASTQYFEYGFDSCRKQAEQQGFVGQLNKESALKEAPELKRPTPLSPDP